MSFILFSVLSEIVIFFENNWAWIYFYYDFGLLAALLLGIAVSFRHVWNEVRDVGKTHALLLLLIIFAFIIIELLFIYPTNQLYSDEYIHMSIAKTMLEDHVAGICSFSTPLHCLPGGLGLFQQPTGWAAMLSIGFLLFGVGFTTAFNLVLVLSVFSILLVFCVAHLLFKNRDISLVSAFMFAFTPLLMTYSRSTVLDVPELTIFMLSVLLLLTYLKKRNFAVGLATVAAIAYTSIMKIDAILIVPILFIFLLLDKDIWNERIPRRDLLLLIALVLILFIIMIPELAFIYMAQTRSSFGVGIGQQTFSFSNFLANLPQNIGFLAGMDGSIIFHGNPNLNLEYPLFYTVFALLGVSFLLYRRKYAQAVPLISWFAVIFIFYTFYYAGGALYSGGDDIRYLFGLFPTIAIFASVGAYNASVFITSKIWIKTKMEEARKRSERRISRARIILLVLLIVIMLDPAFEFITIASKPPQNILTFAVERASQQFVLSHFSQIPKSCFVLTYEPPLWYVLNRSNMYADWVLGNYKNALFNASRGCVYFQYGVECTLTVAGYDNTIGHCRDIMSNYTLETVARSPYREFGWNINFTLYKLVSYKNGTSLLTSNQS